VISQSLQQAGLGLAQVDAIAVTQGPGLVGSLLVGIGVAKALAYSTGKPLVPINHLEGHILAAFLEETPPAFPLIALIVSGGHTNLYHLQDYGSLTLIGRTRDDAAGEAFDKVAKLLDLGYPGGVVIDNLAAGGNPRAISFPRAYLEKGSLDFSFSGIKTAVVNFVRRYADWPHAENADACPEGPWKLADHLPVQLTDIAASFQEAVVDVLVRKTCLAARRYEVRQIVVAGGVAANRRLRQKLYEEAISRGLSVRLPRIELCTDNAAMIAAAGFHKLQRAAGHWDLDFDAISRWPDVPANQQAGGSGEEAVVDS
jgi:N6-L-threonylcarbamoyladenine synthase